MKIVFKDTFINRLENQLNYIALDSPGRARKFKSDLFLRIKQIPSNPYLFRKSIYFKNETIKDLVFKGYTIVFQATDYAREVFGFAKFQNQPTD